MRRTRTRTDRGQAFTLEGFVASVIVLTAILLALQSIVLTPTTGGTVDRQVQQQLQREAMDMMVAQSNYVSDTEADRDLSYLIRLWNGTDTNTYETEKTWAYGVGQSVGYGTKEPFNANETILGEALTGIFTSRGWVFNVLIEYPDPDAPNDVARRRIVYRGVPSDKAVTASTTVTLFDNESLTGANVTPSGNKVACNEKHIEEMTATLDEPDWNLSNSPNCYFPIPEAPQFDVDGDPGPSSCRNPADDETGEICDSPIYSIVRVKVIVW